MTQTVAEPLWMRITKRLVTLTGTGTVFVVAGGLVFGGVSLLAERADAVLGPEPAPMVSVRALSLSPHDGLEVARRFQGQVEPAQTVNLAFQQAGEIEHLTADEGDRIQAGQVIAKLDTRILDAERARLVASRGALAAQVELAQLTADRQTSLRAQGFASQQTLDTARLGLADLEARLAEIDAAVTRIDVQLSQTEIIAPFDGTIAMRLADEGTIAAVGQTVVELLESSAPVFRVGIDPALASDSQALQDASVAINGRDYEARFQGFRPDLDPQTRTRTALYQLNTAEAVYRQAGTLTLRSILPQDGYLMPLSALQDGVRGLWTVLTLEPADGDEMYTVGLEAVEVLHLAGEDVFVRGTFDGDILLVREGVHRIVPGETVRVIEVSVAGGNS